MTTFQCTVSDLAEQMGLEYAAAMAIIKLMEKKGAAKEVGKRPNKGRGKPATIFELQTSFTLNLMEAIPKAEAEQPEPEKTEPETAPEPMQEVIGTAQAEPERTIGILPAA